MDKYAEWFQWNHLPLEDSLLRLNRSRQEKTERCVQNAQRAEILYFLEKILGEDDGLLA